MIGGLVSLNRLHSPFYGSLQYGNRASDGKGSGNARYSMTMSAHSLNYLTMLCETVYAEFNPSKLHPYPNPEFLNIKENNLFSIYLTLVLLLFLQLYIRSGIDGIMINENT
jgi:hypothetical protein